MNHGIEKERKYITLFIMFLEPIVEIKAIINISVAPWYKGTPMPMICIVKQSVLEKRQMHVSEMIFFIPFL